MLEKDRVSAKSGVKDPEMEDSFEPDKSQSDRDDGCAENDNDTCGVHCPQKEREPKPRQAGGPHFVNRDDEVQPGHNGGKPHDEKADDRERDVSVRDGAIGGIECPSGINTTSDDRV